MKSQFKAIALRVLADIASFLILLALMFGAVFAVFGNFQINGGM